MKNGLLVAIALCALVAGVVVNVKAKPDFITLNGDTHQWQDFKGKWVVINYFAQWCAPCLREIPELNLFYQNNPQVPIFAISFDALSTEQLTQLRDKHAINFPILENIQLLPWDGRPTTLPHTIILDPQGRVVKQLKGEQSSESLQAMLNELQEAL